MNAFCVSTDPSVTGRSDKISRLVLGRTVLTSLENVGHDHGVKVWYYKGMSGWRWR
jgi:hypothetical protein